MVEDYVILLSIVAIIIVGTVYAGELYDMEQETPLPTTSISKRVSHRMYNMVKAIFLTIKTLFKIFVIGPFFIVWVILIACLSFFVWFCVPCVKYEDPITTIRRYVSDNPQSSSGVTTEEIVV